MTDERIIEVIAQATKAFNERYEINQRMSLSPDHKPRPVVIFDRLSHKDYEASIIWSQKTTTGLQEFEKAWGYASEAYNKLRAAAVLAALRDHGMDVKSVNPLEPAIAEIVRQLRDGEKKLDADSAKVLYDNLSELYLT